MVMVCGWTQKARKKEVKPSNGSFSAVLVQSGETKQLSSLCLHTWNPPDLCKGEDFKSKTNMGRLLRGKLHVQI